MKCLGAGYTPASMHWAAPPSSPGLQAAVPAAVPVEINVEPRFQTVGIAELNDSRWLELHFTPSVRSTTVPSEPVAVAINGFFGWGQCYGVVWWRVRLRQPSNLSCPRLRWWRTEPTFRLVYSQTTSTARSAV